MGRHWVFNPAQVPFIVREFSSEMTQELTRKIQVLKGCQCIGVKKGHRTQARAVRCLPGQASGRHILSPMEEGLLPPFCPILPPAQSPEFRPRGPWWKNPLPLGEPVQEGDSCPASWKPTSCSGRRSGLQGAEQGLGLGMVALASQCGSLRVCFLPKRTNVQEPMQS